jgi:sensor histidine kinase YesM
MRKGGEAMRTRSRIAAVLGSFRNKWTLSLLGMSLLPLVVSLILVLNITSEHFRNQRIESMLADVDRAQANLENRLSQVWLVGENLTNYMTAQLSRGGSGATQSYSELLRYESLRSNLSATESVYGVTRIRIFSDRLPYVRDGDYLNLFPLKKLTPLTDAHPEILQSIPTNGLKSFLIYNQIVPRKSTRHPYDLIVFYRHVLDVNRKLVAVCLMEYDQTAFLADAGAQIEGGAIRIQPSAGGDSIAQYGPADELQKLGFSPDPGKGYIIRDNRLLIARPLAKAGWTMQVSIPLDSIWSIRGTISEVYLMIILLTFLASLVVGVLLSHFLTRRLTAFYDSVKEIDYTIETSMQALPDRMDALVATGGRDELTQIMASFSALIRDNLQLIGRMRLRDLDIAKYKFQVLQEQINPHFLYNALETLRLCMVAGRQEDALRVLDLLTRFYRIALSKGQETITIQEELRMIQCYLEIENVGYEGRLDWAIRIDEVLNDLPIPKFMLQPLIENSIVHGKIAPGESHLSIRIDIAPEEDEIVMRVTDNGIGIDPDTLAKLRSALTDESVRDKNFGYGLRNVNRRIKLFYGDNYGLSIESRDGQTVNTIRIPVDSL